MPDHEYPVEVQPDFLEKITRAKPLQALAELIWNSLDADATLIEVSSEENELGITSAIVIRDNGTGFSHSEGPQLFQSLGGSWKQPGKVTKKLGRFLHGQDGRGRFKAFTLGSFVEWEVGYDTGHGVQAFKVLMSDTSIRKVRISDESLAAEGRSAGVTVTIAQLHKDYQFLTSDSARQELTELFALYLSSYKAVRIRISGHTLDPALAIASRHSQNLTDIVDGGAAHQVRLEIIEWRHATNRALYLCNENDVPLIESNRRFQVGPFQFSAYLKSPFISQLQRDGVLELAEMNTAVQSALNEAQQAIKDYFRTRAAQEAMTVVAEWKVDHVYPFEGEASTRVEQVERQVFDIVAVNVAQHVPDFASSDRKSKAFSLRLLRQALEKNPEELQLVLGEVLKLPKRKLEELAEVLRDVSLANVITAAKLVSDRLKFLVGLEAILFDADSKKRLKERTQLHQIIADNCWLFGEEYALTVSDEGLTSVLRKHKALLGESVFIDEPVKHISQQRGIVDLVLSKQTRRHKPNTLTHLVVELKAPSVKIDADEVTQLEKYAFSVVEDERFRSVSTDWLFWAISDDYGKYAKNRITDGSGLIQKKDNYAIYVKTWAQVIDENRSRLQFFQEKLEYQVDKGPSVQHLQERYARFLEGVLTDGEEGETASVEAASS